MGTLTFAVMKTELGFLLSNRNDADATNSDRIERWINQAYVYMTHPSVHKFREMQDIATVTLVTDTNEYTVSTLNSRIVTALRWVSFIDATTYTNTATKRILRPRDVRNFERRTLTTGPPTERATEGTTLFISPVPRSQENGKLLRVGHYHEPTVLTTDSQVTTLQSYYDRPLLLVAQAFAERDLQERELSIMTLREAQMLLNNAVDGQELEAEDWGFQVDVVQQSVMI